MTAPETRPESVSGRCTHVMTQGIVSRIGLRCDRPAVGDRCGYHDECSGCGRVSRWCACEPRLIPPWFEDGDALDRAIAAAVDGDGDALHSLFFSPVGWTPASSGGVTT